jgi:geranylgeranyl pyrophosphate synthase
MVIRVLEEGADKDKKRLLEILNLKTKDRQIIEEAIKIINKYKAVEYAKNTAEKIVERAWKKLDFCIESSESKEKLKLFADFLVKRGV